MGTLQGEGGAVAPVAERRLWIPQAAICLLLIGALYPGNPYIYYVLLRWISCPLLAYLTSSAAQQGFKIWAWLLGTLAVLYNPILPVHASRPLWTGANLVTMIVLAVSISTLRRRQRAP